MAGVTELDVGLELGLEPGADEVLTSPLLPGFELDLREVLPDE